MGLTASLERSLLFDRCSKFMQRSNILCATLSNPTQHIRALVAATDIPFALGSAAKFQGPKRSGKVWIYTMGLPAGPHGIISIFSLLPL